MQYAHYLSDKCLTAVILFAVLLSLSCNSSGGKHKGNFYSYSHDGEICRIPLMEPYELTSPSCIDTGNWFFKLPFGTIELETQVSQIRSVGIRDSLLVIYCRDYYKPVAGKNCPDAWFVVDVAAKRDILFTAEKEYDKYLSGRHIDGVQLYRIAKLYDDFDKDGKLPPEWPKAKK